MAIEVVDLGKQPVKVYNPDGTTTYRMEECQEIRTTGKDTKSLIGYSRKADEAKAAHDAALQSKIGMDRLSIKGQPVKLRADQVDMVRAMGHRLEAAAFSIVAPSAPWNAGRGKRVGRFKAVYRNGERIVVEDTLKEV